MLAIRKRSYERYISKTMVSKAFKRVKQNKGEAGVDNQSIKEFESNIKLNLYRIGRRMASGSYFPPPVKGVKIPKKNGGERTLGIPTVSDRIAQMVVKQYLEPRLEKIFHKDSYGYRPRKSALEAVGVVRKRCWKYSWVLELDIKGLFDNIDHSLLMKAVRHHTIPKEKWVVLYIERWLKAEMIKGKEVIKRTKGTPQGGVISPLLANLFLHYAFDKWIEKSHKQTPFVRYADDAVIHCKSKQEAENIKASLKERLKEVGLELHEKKTSIVYCGRKRREGEKRSFDFLGYTFCPRPAKNKKGELFIGFLPAISKDAQKNINQQIRKWGIRKKSGVSLENIAKFLNPKIRGWSNYYGKYYPSKMNWLYYLINTVLMKWARQKFKKLKQSFRKANKWLKRKAKCFPNLFAHWKNTPP